MPSTARFEVRVPIRGGFYHGLIVETNTASEARAEMKRRMDIGRKGRLPVGSRAIRLRQSSPR